MALAVGVNAPLLCWLGARAYAYGESTEGKAEAQLYPLFALLPYTHNTL